MFPVCRHEAHQPEELVVDTAVRGIAPVVQIDRQMKISDLRVHGLTVVTVAYALRTKHQQMASEQRP